MLIIHGTYDKIWHFGLPFSGTSQERRSVPITIIRRSVILCMLQVKLITVI